MTEKKKYLAPQTEVLDLQIPNNMLAGTQHEYDHADAKGQSFDEEEEEDMEEDNFPGWGD